MEKIKLLLCILSINNFMIGKEIRVVSTSAEKLDMLARKHWTDKAPIPHGEGGHNYIEHYERHFSHLQNKKIKLLEIGFGDGGSAKMWEEYFPNAEIHYLNVPASDYEKHGHRVSEQTHLHIGDQRKPEDLQDLIDKTGSNFDIIIDDGGHAYENQKIAFTFLFPHVKNGGCYVIEDLCESYWGKEGKKNPKLQNPSTIFFLKILIDELNYVPARNVSSAFEFCPKSILNNLNYYQKNIYGILFYSNISFIFKR